MNLIHCIYSSRATAHLEEPQIHALLERARANNDARNITGMLLYIEGSFFQVLEGDAATVDQVYELIAADKRHDRVTQIIREPIARRSFGEWSMGFENIQRVEAQRLAGVNQGLAAADGLEQIQAGRAKKLLMAFRQGRWRTESTGMHRAHARVS